MPCTSQCIHTLPPLQLQTNPNQPCPACCTACLPSLPLPRPLPQTLWPRTYPKPCTSKPSTDIIVDPFFTDAFIQQPATPTYSQLLSQLPRAFVGTEVELRRVVALLTQQSMRAYASKVRQPRNCCCCYRCCRMCCSECLQKRIICCMYAAAIVRGMRCIDVCQSGSQHMLSFILSAAG